MTPKLKQAFQHEMLQAKQHFKLKDYEQSFYHLERAHILGQRYVIPHTYSHCWMLKVGWQRRDFKEIVGQFSRIAASIVFSRIWVPLGNTGGANVNPLKPMAIPANLRKYFN